MDQPLLTLGHGTATADEFSAIALGAGINSIVDVRAFPGSRRHPHFAREALLQWLPERAGIGYSWTPELGGFRKRNNPESLNTALRHPSFRAYADYMETAPFEAALDALLRRAAAERVAILCSESLWWRCHRRLIADAATLLRHVPVQHVMHDGKLQSHVSTSGVRITGDGRLCYDVDAEPQLPLEPATLPRR